MPETARVMAMAFPQSIDRARLAWRRSPIPPFLRWWGGELAAMLPRRLRGWACRGPEVLWLLVRNGVVDVRDAAAGRPLASIDSGLPEDVQRATLAEACAGIDPADRRLLLIVQQAQVLVRRLVMPAAAVADPRRVAGYEIDRQTPFKAEQVEYDVRESPDPAPHGQVALDLVAVPKATLEPMLARCALLGVRPDAIVVDTGNGVLAGIDLLPRGRRPRRVDRRRRANWLLGAACALLAVLVLLLWLDNRRAALVRMQAEVDAMRAQADQSEQLRGQLTGAIAASKFLVKRKADRPTALAVLDDLTRRLPDSAWLFALTLDDSGGLDIRGEAAKAAALVDTLGNSTMLQEPKLQGVI